MYLVLYLMASFHEECVMSSVTKGILLGEDLLNLKQQTDHVCIFLSKHQIGNPSVSMVLVDGFNPSRKFFCMKVVSYSPPGRAVLAAITFGDWLCDAHAPFSFGFLIKEKYQKRYICQFFNQNMQPFPPSFLLASCSQESLMSE